MTGSELSDALGLDRAAVIKAWRMAYVRREDEPDDDLYRAGFHSIGIDDDVNITFLLRGWAHLRELRADLPGEPGGKLPEAAPTASPGQLSYLDGLLSRKGLPKRDPVFKFTAAEASKAIEEVKAGTYDPKRYEIPF